MNRPRSLWPWIVPTLIVVPVLYVASFWPACWLLKHDMIPIKTAAIFYKPVVDLVLAKREWLMDQNSPTTQVIIYKMKLTLEPETLKDLRF